MSHHDDNDERRPSHTDPAVDRAWRHASTDEPPSRLDRELVAAAHNAVAEDGQLSSARTQRAASRNWLGRWQPLLAAAAVAGLAVVVVPMLPRNHPLEMKVSSPASTPEPVENSAPTPASPTAGAASPAPSSGLDRDTREKPNTTVGVLPAFGDHSRSTVPAPPPAVPPPAAAPSAVASEAARQEGAIESNATTDAAATNHERLAPRDDERSVDKRKSVSDSSPAQGPLNAAAPSAMAAPSPARQQDAAQAAPRDPAAWATEIVTLHDAGDLNAAADALREFRARYRNADTYLPRSLSDWARTVE